MIPYYASTDLITNSEISYLEKLALSLRANFKKYDTISGKKDGNLCWDIDIEKFNKFNLKSYTFFVHQKPFTNVISHIDNPKWKRNTVLIIPLFWSEKYAPCYFNDGVKVHQQTPYLFNTQLPHYVNNNEYPRYNFQICFEESIEKVVKCLTPR